MKPTNRLRSIDFDALIPRSGAHETRFWDIPQDPRTLEAVDRTGCRSQAGSRPRSSRRYTNLDKRDSQTASFDEHICTVLLVVHDDEKDSASL